MNEVQIDIIFTSFFVTKDVTKALRESIELQQEKIFELNYQQLDKGLDSENVDLGAYARFEYKGRYRPIDLLLTGEWRDAFTLDTNDTETTIYSTNFKMRFLAYRYGENINGIPEYLIPAMGNIIRNEFIQFFKAQ